MAAIASIVNRAESQPLPGRRAGSRNVAYFAPCHQREQKIGRPCLELLMLISGLTVEPVSDTEGCGMGGNFGFKAEFHEKCLAVGRPLLAKIRKMDPQAIITDGMSCRLQFERVLPHPVFHPLEILAKAYQHSDISAGSGTGAR